MMKEMNASGGDIFGQKKQGFVNHDAARCRSGTGGDADGRARRSTLSCFTIRGSDEISPPFLLATNIPAGGINLLLRDAGYA